MHPEPVEQQSVFAVHGSPSATHVEAQENPAGLSRQNPEQHSEGVAQVVPGDRQAPSPEGSRHRCAPEGGGAFTHIAPGQQSPLPPHVSPSAAHVDGGWQIPRVPSCALHAPEQQSAPEEHSSHSPRQPPPGAHRLRPPASGTHSREQQSSLPPQISPTWRVHILWSFSVHMGQAMQCPTDCASSWQRLVQQSALEPQISPWTRQPSRRAQWPALQS